MHSAQFLSVFALASLAFLPAASAAGNGALDRTFGKADINSDGFLDSTEFLALQRRGKSWADAMHRFNQADVTANGLLGVTEFRASNGGKEGGKPNKVQTFALVDLDDDGLLDPEEFARTLAQSKPWRKVLRDFDRKDKDDDALINPREFGILASAR